MKNKVDKRQGLHGAEGKQATGKRIHLSARKSLPSKRITLVVRQDLTSRINEKAAFILHEPHQFLHLCVEGILDAMDAEGGYDIPILRIYQTISGKMFVSFKAVRNLCAAALANFEEADHFQRAKFWSLLDRHEGPLDLDRLKEYWDLAQDMNQKRKVHEAEMERLLEMGKNS